MAHIAIVGAGIGGVPCAYELRKMLGKEHRVTLIGSSPYFEFAPSNPWVAVGWRQTAQVHVELHDHLEAKGVQWIPSRVTAIDAPGNTLTLHGGQQMRYDYLVIATGPRLAFEEVPGLGPVEGGYTQSICTHAHSVRAWEAYQEFLKNPGPIVIGAAPGASCFGPAYEFAMIVDTDLRRRRIRDRVPMTFVTSEPYVGHMGLGGVGDSRGLMESTLRQRHIKWITNARVASVDPGRMHVEEVAEDGAVKATHDLDFAFSMMLPAFRGVPAVSGIEGLTNPRGFILVDRHQANPTYPNVFALGVCVAIPPTGKTPVPVGVPKTGFMIESMVTAIAQNLKDRIEGREPAHEATWNAICLADFGDGGVAFVAQPQIPPRNVNWSASGKWVHLAKVGFEKYFLAKVRRGESEPFYEKLALDVMGVKKLKS